MTAPIPDLVLNNGVTMPPIGLGVFQSPPEETAAARAWPARTCSSRPRCG